MAITSILKGLAGAEDIAFDTSGQHRVLTREKSDGNSITVRSLNASHLPTTATTRLQDGHDGDDNAALNVDAALLKAFLQLYEIGKPDSVTVEANGSSGSRVLRVKDLGISSGKITDGAVVEAKIGTGAVVEAKIGPNAVTPGKIAADAVTESKILNLNVTEGKIATAAVTATKIADDAIGKDHIRFDTAGTPPGAFIVEMGQHTLDAVQGVTQAFPITASIVSGDILIATASSIAVTGCHLEHAIISGSNASYHFNIDPTGGTMNYIVLRPVTV